MARRKNKHVDELPGPNTPEPGFDDEMILENHVSMDKFEYNGSANIFVFKLTRGGMSKVIEITPEFLWGVKQ